MNSEQESLEHKLYKISNFDKEFADNRLQIETFLLLKKTEIIPEKSSIRWNLDNRQPAKIPYDYKKDISDF